MKLSISFALVFVAGLATGASAQARAQAVPRPTSTTATKPAATKPATTKPATTTPATNKAPTATPAGAKKTVEATVPVPAADTSSRVLINREIFSYDGDGRRDPFVSLLTTSDLRPLLTDLKLVAVAYDTRGSNSVAVLRDTTSKSQYRVRVGQTIGRMRVAAIQEKAVIFTIEEFGYSRQEILPIIADSTKTRPRQ